MKKNCLEIINIGLYPPPHGGISVFLQRLIDLLNNKGIKNSIIDTSNNPDITKINSNISSMSWPKALLKLLFIKKSIIHIHAFTWKAAPFFYLIGRRNKLIIQLHNERFLDDFNSCPSFLRKLILFLLSPVNEVIIVSNNCYSLAGKIFKHAHLSIIPAFIKPPEIPNLKNKTILDLKKNFQYLISSNASKIAFHKNEDLYGLDLLVELAFQLKEANISTGFCFILTQDHDHPYLEEIHNKICSYDIADRFLILTESLDNALPLWKSSDLIIRPTNTDGNSVTILEALSVGTPVIASNCVPRPEQTILFKNRDSNDLFIKTKEVLSRIDLYKKKINKSPALIDNSDAILNMYYNLKKSCQ